VLGASRAVRRGMQGGEERVRPVLVLAMGKFFHGSTGKKKGPARVGEDDVGAARSLVPTSDA